MTSGPILASHFHPITTCRLLTFLRGDRVVFTDRFNPDDEMQTAEANKPEFTMRLQDLGRWDHYLREDDLIYNNVRRATSSLHLQEFRERLQRKRYIGNAVEDVRAAFPCCRLPDLRCSRYMRGSGGLGLGSLQRPRTHISRAASQRRPTHRTT
jgi:hypothetical protein